MDWLSHLTIDGCKLRVDIQQLLQNLGIRVEASAVQRRRVAETEGFLDDADLLDVFDSVDVFGRQCLREELALIIVSGPLCQKIQISKRKKFCLKQKQWWAFHILD